MAKSEQEKLIYEKVQKARNHLNQVLVSLDLGNLESAAAGLRDARHIIQDTESITWETKEEDEVQKAAEKGFNS